MFETSCYGGLQCQRCPLVQLDNDDDFNDQDRRYARNGVLLLPPIIGERPNGLDQLDEEVIKRLMRESIKATDEMVAEVVVDAIAMQLTGKCK